MHSVSLHLQKQPQLTPMVPTSALTNMELRPNPSESPPPPPQHWECPKCTMKNPIHNVNCRACLEPKPGRRITLQEEQDSVPQSGVVRPRLSSRLRALFSRKPPDWECPNCTLVNGGYYTQCQTCRFLRITDKPRSSSSEGEGRVRSVSEETEEEGSVMNSVLGFFRRLSMAGGRPGEGGGKTPREKRGTGEQWSCEKCTLLNPSELEKCSACKTPRPSDKEANGDSIAGHLESDDPSSSLHRSEEYAPVNPHPAPHQRRLSDSQVFSSHHSNHQVANDRGFPTPESQWQEPTHEDNFISLPAMAVTPSPDLESRGLVSLVTSQGSPTWQCNICGAYNVVMRALRQCYICGIGVIPECYLPSSPTEGSRDITEASRGAQATATFPHHQRGLQGERPQNGRNGRNGVSGPIGQQRHGHLQSSDSHSPKQKHPLTHHNDLRFPEHNACFNEGDLPLLEQPRDQYTNGHCVKEFSRDSNPNIQANDRGLPPQSKQDRHVRPKTPTSQKRVQAPAERREPRHQRQRSDEGARVHWLEESIQFNRTKCLNEIRYEDVLMANTVYRGIKMYCREVSGEERKGET